VRDRGPEPPSRRWLLLVAALSAGALLVGVALGATVIQGGTESGGGMAEQTSFLSWLAVNSVRADTIPGPIPASVSTSASSPTVLPSSNESFLLGTGHVSDSALRWDLQMSSPPPSTEAEVTFEVVNATTGAVTIFSAFVESPSTPPSNTPLMSFYLDDGTESVVLAGETVVAQQCAGIGSCP
jgi:hypothetical protein